MKKFALTFSWIIVASFAIHAQVELLKDIQYTATQTSQTTIELESPEGFIALGSKVIFKAYDDIHGWELWVTDNTHEGTYLLKDLSTNSSEPASFTLLNGVVYFAAGTENLGRELWKTDGTTEGTVIVADINPGGESGMLFPDFLTELNGELYFIANDVTGDDALWKSDGTAEGTVKVKPMVFDTSSAGPFRFAKMGNAIFINAYDDEHGSELWKSDGTAEGTVMVKDLVPGADYGYPRTITQLNSEIFFVGFSSTQGTLDLWKSDGTTEGTLLLKNIYQQYTSYSTELRTSAGLLFFTSDDGATGRELWRTDGTPGGTFMINKSTLEAEETFPVDVNGTVYFVSSNGSGSELWKTDGTVGGTMLVKDINAGSLSSSPAGLTQGENMLYFVANDGTNGEALWQSDGTDEGTILAKHIGYNSNIRNLAFINGSLYFQANDRIGSNTRLWMYDPVEKDATNLGYRFTYDYDYSGSGNPYDFIKVNEIFYFKANDGVHGFELWKSDGTASGTSLVKDINTGTADSYFYDLTPADGLLFFSVDDGIHGKEIWKTDGTAEGTVMVKDINPGSESSYPQYLVFLNGAVYFSAEDGSTNGTELWKTDGTENGTVMVKDIYPGDYYSSAPYNLTRVGNAIYFIAYDEIHYMGLGIWKSDGTTEGTVIVNDADSPIGSVNYSWAGNLYLKGVNETLYFGAYSEDFGYGLWKSDGTAEGTVPVKDINAGIGQLTELNGVLYFTADDGVHGYELWKSNGTATGTVLVKDTYPGSTSGYPGGLIATNNLLFFSAIDENNDLYVWRTDGTTEGTFKVKSSDPNESTKDAWTVGRGDGDEIFFSNSISMFAQHLWRTDGTPCGTVRLTGDEGMSIADLIFLDNKALFSGDFLEGDHGRELYAYNMEGLPPTQCQHISFDPIAPKKYGDAGFTLSASASSDLPVQYSSSDPGIISINNNIVTILKAGSTTITANQPGNSSFKPASEVSQLFVVDKASLTATADSKTIVYGDAIPVLTVSYSGFKMSDDESTLDSQPVVTTVATQTSAPDLYTISLAEGLDDNYTITLVTGILEIKKMKQTINVVSVPDKTVDDLPFTVMATATSGLPVIITTATQKVNLNDQTITMLDAGNVTIRASQSGDKYYEAATPVDEDFCVNPAKPQITFNQNNTDTSVIIESSSAVGNQWFLNSNILVDEDQPFLEIKENGTYAIQVTRDNCRSELSEPLVIILPINNQLNEIASLFPNPVEDKLFIELKSLQNSAEDITIMDLKGVTKAVIPVQGQSNIEIDISSYPSGAYMVLINSKESSSNIMFIKK